jgi:hypothetical protein
MKKLIAFIVLLILVQFQISIKPREVQAQDVVADLGKRFDVRSYTYYSDGMNYRIFVLGDGYTSVAIDVVNTTKDKLEVQRLELEIARLKKLK